jgi:tetraprenyl-beta-curcumene synthase
VPGQQLGSPRVPTIGDRLLVARALVALALANARFWPSVWPRVQAQLRRWERRAGMIEDLELRALALEKLRDERFNAEVAATLATLAPRGHRQAVIEAIVALEVLYDYLDGLTEQPTGDPLGDGEALFGAFTGAVDVSRRVVDDDYFRDRPRRDDGGYLSDLAAVTRRALQSLPATVNVAEAAGHAAARCAQAQVRKHAAAALGTEQLEGWARRQAEGTPLGWRELIAGAASSVLAVHALIAAAAESATTREDATKLAETYLLTGVLITSLDSLVDHGDDVGAGDPGFVGLYHDPDELAVALSDACMRAAANAATLRNGPHHLMTLAGVVAYYTSGPGARSQIARPIAEQLQRQLRPIITPTLAVMRSWRVGKRAAERWR